MVTKSKALTQKGFLNNNESVFKIQNKNHFYIKLYQDKLLFVGEIRRTFSGMQVVRN